jgi:hypothetical protein
LIPKSFLLTKKEILYFLKRNPSKIVELFSFYPVCLTVKHLQTQGYILGHINGSLRTGQGQHREKEIGGDGGI